MPSNVSEHAKLDQNANVFSANLPHNYNSKHTPIQQYINPLTLPTSKFQIPPLQPLVQPPARTSESTANAPAFPFTNPPGLHFDVAPTPSQFSAPPSQPRQTVTGRKKRGRPAKPVPAIPQIPSIPGLNPGFGYGTAHVANVAASSQTASASGFPPYAWRGSYYAAAQHSMSSGSSTIQPSVSGPPSTWQPQQNVPANVDWKAHTTMRDQYASSQANESEVNPTEPFRKRFRLEHTGFKPVDGLASTSRLESNIGNSQPQPVRQAQSETSLQRISASSISRIVKGSPKRTRGSTKLPRGLSRTFSLPPGYSYFPSSPLAKPPILPPTSPRTVTPPPPTQPPLPCLPLSPVLLRPDPELEPYSDPSLTSLPLPVFDAEYKPQPSMSQDEFVEALLELREPEECFGFVSINEHEIIERAAF